jgi:hypothetical protein
MPYAGIDAVERKPPAAQTPDHADVPMWQYNNMLLIDQLRKSWSSIALGIILAGGAYPLLAGIIAFTIETILDWPGVYDPFGLSLAVLMFSTVGAVVGMVWTNVWVVGTLPIVLIVVWSLKIRGSIVWVGAFWGGFVGCIAVLPFLLMASFNDNLLIGLALGPALTTIIGQAGGAWGGRRAIGRIAWHERTFNRESAIRYVSLEMDLERDSPVPPPRFQFRIRHLLWAAVWISVLLSAIRVLGLQLEIVLPFLCGWLVYQAATLWIGGRLVLLMSR